MNKFRNKASLFVSFLSDWLEGVRDLEVGGRVIVNGGWLVAYANRPRSFFFILSFLLPSFSFFLLFFFFPLLLLLFLYFFLLLKTYSQQLTTKQQHITTARGHALMYILERDSETEYAFTTVNTGSLLLSFPLSPFFFFFHFSLLNITFRGGK